MKQRVKSNWPLDTETQLQEAASPQVLRSGQLQRYTSIGDGVGHS